MSNHLKTLILSSRAPFLILTPVSMFLSVSMIDLSNANDWFTVALIFLGALSAHISVNAFNEYWDYKSGLDKETIKTPFSGGSGALVENPRGLSSVFILGCLSLSVTILIGLYFTWLRGIGLLPLGATGVILVITYTQWLNKNPWLCLIAPGLGFGPLMVMGTYFVATGGYAWQPLLVSMLPFFLVNNVLLLNQLPDKEADKTAGRNHIVIVYGENASILIYLIFLLLAGLTIIFSVLLNFLPLHALIGLFFLMLGLLAYIGARKYYKDIPKLIPYLALNVSTAIFTPIAVGLSLMMNA